MTISNLSVWELTICKMKPTNHYHLIDSNCTQINCHINKISKCSHLWITKIREMTLEIGGSGKTYMPSKKNRRKLSIQISFMTRIRSTHLNNSKASKIAQGKDTTSATNQIQISWLNKPIQCQQLLVQDNLMLESSHSTTHYHLTMDYQHKQTCTTQPHRSIQTIFSNNKIL